MDRQPERRHVSTGGAPCANQRVRQRALAGAGRPGDSDYLARDQCAVKFAPWPEIPRGAHSQRKRACAPARGARPAQTASIKSSMSEEVAVTPPPRVGAFSRMKRTAVSIGVPGPNTSATPIAFNASTSSSGIVPPATTSTSSNPAAAKFGRRSSETARDGLPTGSIVRSRQHPRQAPRA